MYFNTNFDIKSKIANLENRKSSHILIEMDLTGHELY